jgi:hypothetical protein
VIVLVRAVVAVFFAVAHQIKGDALLVGASELVGLAHASDRRAAARLVGIITAVVVTIAVVVLGNAFLVHAQEVRRVALNVAVLARFIRLICAIVLAVAQV